MLIYKAKQFFMTRKNSKKNLHILEDAANDVQIGDIEHVIVFFKYKNYIKLVVLKLDVFFTFLEYIIYFRASSQNFKGHEIYVENQTQPFAFEHHFY